jgi:hypothetical protein
MLVASSFFPGEDRQTSGLHAYCPLDQEIDPDQWQPYADGLQALFVRHGVLVDPPRTTDRTGILRPPGTTNRKAERCGLVQLLRLNGPYKLEQFAALPEASKEGRKNSGRKVAPADAPPIFTPDVVAAAAVYLNAPHRLGHKERTAAALATIEEEYPPADLNLIAERCEQVKKFRDWTPQQGELPEPEWSNSVWLAAHCENGPELAHQWSARGDARYSFDETQDKLDRSPGPTTCKQFHKHNPAVCEACPHWGKITSPIRLGHVSASAGFTSEAEYSGRFASGGVSAGSSAAVAAGPPLGAPAMWAPQKDQIDALNEQFFLIENIGGDCVVGELVPNATNSGLTLALMRPQPFRVRFGNQQIVVRDRKGNEKLKSLGQAWLEHPKRRQYKGVVLVPNAPEKLEDGNLNLWRGFGVEPKRGQWPLMQWHICNVLADRNPNAAEYVMRWTAHGLQRPDERPEVALVLRGDKGSGKGVYGETLVRFYGEHSLHIFHQSHLTGNFNGHLRLTLFLFADEAFWAGSKQAESVLKGLITERTLMIEQKYFDAVKCLNRLHVLMSANANWVVPASHDERRYAVFDVSNRYAKNAVSDDERNAYFDALYEELNNGGREAMFYDMLHWDLGSWHPRQVYEGEGLRKQKALSLSPIDKWFLHLLQEGKLPGMYKTADGQVSLPSTRMLIEDARTSAPRLRDLSEQEFADFLKEKGCTPSRTKLARGWSLPPLPQLRAQWERRMGGGWSWDDPDLTEWQL